MIKTFALGVLMLIGLAGFSQAQKTTVETKYRKISQMIADSQKGNGLFTDLLGSQMLPANDKTESTVLSAINFPNSVKVKFTGRIRKMSKSRKEIVNKWLTDYAEKPHVRYFYVNEIEVEEDGAKYWVMAHENAVVAKLKNSAELKGETILKMKILGYRKKGRTVEPFLLADEQAATV